MATEQLKPTSAKRFLHLGCGRNTLPEHLNVDCVALPNVEMVVDLNRYPWPFATGSWERVVAHHVFEHLEDFDRAMAELHRILAPGGVADIWVPHVAGWGAWNDPTHRKFFTRQSFGYYAQGHAFHYYYGDVAFSRVRCRNVFGVGASAKLNWLMNPLLNTTLFDWWLWKLIPAAEVRAELVK